MHLLMQIAESLIITPLFKNMIEIIAQKKSIGDEDPVLLDEK